MRGIRRVLLKSAELAGHKVRKRNTVLVGAESRRNLAIIIQIGKETWSCRERTHRKGQGVLALGQADHVA